MHPNDLCDVLAAQRGEEAAFGRLCLRYRPIVYAAALALLPAPEAEEAAQEVMIAAWTRLPELRDPGALAGWLRSIARARATDRLRQRQAEARRAGWGRVFAAWWAPAAAPDEDPAELAEILAAIRALPEAYREPLLLRLVEGWTGPEIAARVGMAEGSVRVNLHRGMAMLRERLGAPGRVRQGGQG